MAGFVTSILMSSHCTLPAFQCPTSVKHAVLNVRTLTHLVLMIFQSFSEVRYHWWWRTGTGWATGSATIGFWHTVCLQPLSGLQDGFVDIGRLALWQVPYPSLSQQVIPVNGENSKLLVILWPILTNRHQLTCDTFALAHLYWPAKKDWCSQTVLLQWWML